MTTYILPRYRKTNQNMSITLRPTVMQGEKVTKGQILTEGYSTDNGELAWAATSRWRSCPGRDTTSRMPS